MIEENTKEGIKTNKPDIYFEEEYGKLSLLLEEEGSELLYYVYEDENGKISNLAIKRLININVDGKQYFDITTPYGYGGPIIEYINQDIENSKEKLLENFEKDFTKYCLENNIVSEFVRFHPIIENALDFKKMYNSIFIQNTIATYCDNGNPTEVEFTKSARKTIRRSLAANVRYEIIENPVDLEDFKEVYYETMDRHDVKKYYYFKKEYFDYIINNFNNNIFNVNIIDNETNLIISSGLYFIYDNKYVHAHLSGTRPEYLHFSPAYILKQVVAEWAYNKGYKLVHYGGGTSSDPENSLYLFKRKFTKRDPLDFYIGKKIYNNEIYDKLVEMTNTKESKFFPQFRDPSIVK